MDWEGVGCVYYTCLASTHTHIYICMQCSINMENVPLVDLEHELVEVHAPLPLYRHLLLGTHVVVRVDDRGGSPQQAPSHFQDINVHTYIHIYK